LQLTMHQDPMDPLLMHRQLQVDQPHWIGPAPRLPLECTAQIRYRQREQSCRIDALPGGGCAVQFAAPQRAATPGQHAVFYQGEQCLGGGMISRLLRSGAGLEQGREQGMATGPRHETVASAGHRDHKQPTPGQVQPPPDSEQRAR